MTKQCEQCNRAGRNYKESYTSYEESGVRTYYQTVVRCGYHARSSRFYDYEVEN